MSRLSVHQRKSLQFSFLFSAGRLGKSTYFSAVFNTMSPAIKQSWISNLQMAKLALGTVHCLTVHLQIITIKHDLIGSKSTEIKAVQMSICLKDDYFSFTMKCVESFILKTELVQQQLLHTVHY